MITSPGPAEFADSYLVEVLDEFGLAQKYVRAAGNTLFHLADDGTEVGVLDCASGFGSLMFGHNNPDLVAHAKWLLDAQTPIHAQFSGYSYAVDLAAALNSIIRRELQTEDKFYGLFGNSGAEAVEITIKHAELDRGARIAELEVAVGAHVDAARSAVAAGAALSDRARAMLGGDIPGADAPGGDVAAFERLVTEIDGRNARTRCRPPLFLALEGGFHGKLVSSVQLTHNEEFRGPFTALAAQARFVPMDHPELIAKVAEEERAVLLGPVVRDGVVDVAEHEFPIFAAFLVEPILGEAGIKPMTRELAAAVRKACDAIGCPLVSDEIQSGMGRSGTFLAGTQIGLVPDYVIVAKALGGGIAKLGATDVPVGAGS